MGNYNRVRTPAAPIKHGTPWGYQAHIQRDVPMCDECRIAYKNDQTAKRIRLGQDRLHAPAEVVGSLLLAVTNESTRQYAIAALGPKTAAACVERALAVRS